jgi:hypothetical protein
MVRNSRRAVPMMEAEEDENDNDDGAQEARNFPFCRLRENFIPLFRGVSEIFLTPFRIPLWIFLL